MATVKSREKSKSTKKLQAKTTTKPRVSKAKKTIENKPVSTQPALVPISPEFEEKLTKHYYEMEKYFRGTTYGTPIFTLYLLYLVIKSRGEILLILNFLGFVVITIGLTYCSHLFTKQSKKSIAAYGYTMGFALLFSACVIWIIDLNRYALSWLIGFFIILGIFVEMLRLKKYNFLY